MTPNKFKNYLTMIHNSIGTKMFRNFFAEINGKEVDVLENGDKSCGVHVSSLLYMNNLINAPHATVTTTLKDMRENGWEEIQEPRDGCVIHWEKTDKSNQCEHLGFYVGNDKAISNSSKKGYPKKHHWTYGKSNDGPKRKVLGLYWNPSLD